MAGVDLMPLLGQLDDNVDDLEEALEPLLTAVLSTTMSKLPVLDKAKLYVLLTYTIESLLFSYLRLNGVNAKEHQVFKELTRVKQYFEKIKIAETGPIKRENLSLNKQAADRVIKHALSGNDRIDLERAEREAREKAQAQIKLARLNQQDKSIPQKRQSADEEDETSNTDSTSSSSEELVEASPAKTEAAKKQPVRIPTTLEQSPSSRTEKHRKGHSVNKTRQKGRGDKKKRQKKKRTSAGDSTPG